MFESLEARRQIIENSVIYSKRANKKAVDTFNSRETYE